MSVGKSVREHGGDGGLGLAEDVQSAHGEAGLAGVGENVIVLQRASEVRDQPPLARDEGGVGEVEPGLLLAVGAGAADQDPVGGHAGEGLPLSRGRRRMSQSSSPGDRGLPRRRGSQEARNFL